MCPFFKKVLAYTTIQDPLTVFPLYMILSYKIRDLPG